MQETTAQGQVGSRWEGQRCGVGWGSTAWGMPPDSWDLRARRAFLDLLPARVTPSVHCVSHCHFLLVFMLCP